MVWALVGLATVVGPFALAGRTGNPLWIAAPVAVTLAYVALRESPRCLAYYRSLWPGAWAPALFAALAALVLTLGIASGLSLLPPNQPLNASLGSLFKVGGDAGANGFAIPLATPLLAAIYAPLAILALPLLAWWEEDIFRRGTTGVRSACIRSLLFGLLHVTAGVSLGICLALGCAGYVFTLVYWRALRDPHAADHRAALPDWARNRILLAATGRSAAEQYAVYRATQAHLLYNAIGVTTIILSTFFPSHF
ncbi:MAG TPA: hypothetical protein VNL71_09200 [Chloroflexota bacterium]|nr:hypothetical protein [Chloroflexota bacterium]